MSLDVSLYRVEETCLYDANITHNLGEMATQAGIYYALWRPEEINISLAGDLVPLLKAGLFVLKNKQEYFESFNSDNGWGTYEHFVPFVENYLKACELYPDAKISISR